MNPTTTLTTSELRAHVSQTFFNSTTTVKSQSSSQSPILSIDKVRRMLDFSSKAQVSINQQYSQQMNQPIIPATLSEETETEYYSLQKVVGQSLRREQVAPYYMSLNRADTGWSIYIVVGKEFHDIVTELVSQTPTVHVSLQVLEGDFSFSTLPFSDTDWSMELKPSPGRSIGPDWRELDEGVIPQNSGTLGGYVYGKATKRVFGLTCGHLVFGKPSSNSLHRPVRIHQPSDYDYMANLESTRQAIAKAQTTEARSWYENQYEQLQNIAHNRLLGKIMHATWSILSNPFDVPEVADYALIHLPNRT